MLGHVPSEPARLVRNMLAAYGRAESVVFGRVGVDAAVDRVVRGAAEARQVDPLGEGRRRGLARRCRHGSFDIAIVGGGAAGCVLARRLAEPGTDRVVLLEAGPDLRRATPAEWRDGWTLPTVPDWGFESEPDGGGATGKLRRGRVLGGTSWLTRFAVRGAPRPTSMPGRRGATRAGPSMRSCRRSDGSKRTPSSAATRGTGIGGPLPITRYPELEPSRRSTRAALEAFAAVGFPPVPDHNAPGAVGAGRCPMSTRDGARVTTLDAYLPADVAAAEPLDPRRIRWWRSRDHRGAAGRPACGLWMAREIHADQVILAAGTYGSPTILLRSGVGPADDLASLGHRRSASTFPVSAPTWPTIPASSWIPAGAVPPRPARSCTRSPRSEVRWHRPTARQT